MLVLALQNLFKYVVAEQRVLSERAHESVVREACSRAVKDTASDNIDIDLDALDLPAFLVVDKYVSEAVGRRKQRH